MKPARSNRAIAGICSSLVIAACGISACTATPEPQPLPASPTAPVTGPTSSPPSVSTPPPLPLPSAPPADSLAFRELQASLEIFSREMIGQGAPAVLVEARSGQQVWRHAAGVRSLDGGDPAEPGDLMGAGGILRSMLAVSTLKLFEEGLVALDATVGTYLPEGAGSGPETPSAAERSTTLRQLLADPSGRDSSRRADTLLALVLERVRAAPLAEVLRGDIWNPVGMQSTVLWPAVDASPDLVHGYAVEEGKTVDVTMGPPGRGQGPPRLFASTADINSFHAALLGGRLLAPSSLLLMKGPAAAEYGLGLDQWDDRCTNGDYYGHSGDLPGYGTIALSSADGNRQLTISVAYPPQPVTDQPSAIVLEITSLAQVLLNGSCRFRFG